MSKLTDLLIAAVDKSTEHTKQMIRSLDNIDFDAQLKKVQDLSQVICEQTKSLTDEMKDLVESVVNKKDEKDSFVLVSDCDPEKGDVFSYSVDGRNIRACVENKTCNSEYRSVMVTSVPEDYDISKAYTKQEKKTMKIIVPKVGADESKPEASNNGGEQGTQQENIFDILSDAARRIRHSKI